MRRSILTACLSLAALFAFALASADGTTTGTDTGMQQPGSAGEQQQADQPGQTGQEPAGDIAGAQEPITDSPGAAGEQPGEQPMAEQPRTCTDASGIVYRRGTQGYERCLQEQRAGEAAQPTSPETMEDQPGMADEGMGDQQSPAGGLGTSE